MTAHKRFERKLQVVRSRGGAAAGIARRLARAQAVERRLAREIGTSPADVVRCALEDDEQGLFLARPPLFR